MSGFVFLTQNSGGTPDLYATDGTAGGTVDLDVSRFGFQPDAAFEASQTPASGSPASDSVTVGGRMLFLGSSGTGAGTAPLRIFSTDGTAAGTLVANGPANVGGLWSVNDIAVTDGQDARGAYGLYASADGVNFNDIVPGLQVSAFGVSGNTGYFSGSLGGGPASLWRTDGTAAGTLQVTPAG